MRARLLHLVLPVAALFGLLAPAAASADLTAAGTLRLVPVGSFDSPTYVAAAPGDARRIFVVQKGGAIRVVRDGTVLPGTFLTVPNVHDSGEQGLLSMAFAPDYAATGRFYVYYNDGAACHPNCDIRVDEFRRADDDHADPTSQRRVLSIDHGAFENHNGGQLEFGPDGFLYLGVGDGGSANDPSNNGQNRNTLLGKILRIDPRAGGGAAYTAPPSNPFSGPTPGADEIWAYGLRNPWRFSFDHLTGGLVIGDVGQDRHEEIDLQPPSFGGGANYGWRLYEGFERVSDPGGPQPSDYVPPVFAYDHVGANCSITGGYFVRDQALPELAGRYLYGDYCQGDLRSLSLAVGRASGDAPVGDPGNAAAPPLHVAQLASFGQDALCRLYAVSQAGPVYRLASTQSAAQGCTAAPAPPADRQRPVLTRLTMTPRRFAVGRSPTALSARRRRTPRGSAFRFTLSEPATVRIRVERARPGRRVGRRCAAATPRLRHRRACLRYAHVGTLTRRLAAGRRKVGFSGRVGSRALAPGGYRALLVAVDPSGNASRARTVSFTIVSR
jgi:glucose/arabinose dehydrogenase